VDLKSRGLDLESRRVGLRVQASWSESPGRLDLESTEDSIKKEKKKQNKEKLPASSFMAPSSNHQQRLPTSRCVAPQRRRARCNAPNHRLASVPDGRATASVTYLRQVRPCTLCAGHTCTDRPPDVSWRHGPRLASQTSPGSPLSPPSAPAAPSVAT